MRDLLIIVYLVGTLIGFFRTDAKVFQRLVLSLLWPLGPLAFVVTLVILLAASPFAFLPKRAG